MFRTQAPLSAPRAASLAILALTSSAASAQFDIVSHTGDRVPAGDAVITGYIFPTINDQGTVLLYVGEGPNTSQITGFGAYRVDPTGLVELLRDGDPAPDNDGTTLIDRLSPALGNDDRALVIVNYNNASAQRGAGGLLIGPNDRSEPYRLGDAIPEGGSQSLVLAGFVTLLSDGSVGLTAGYNGDGGPIGRYEIRNQGTVTELLRRGESIGSDTITSLLTAPAFAPGGQFAGPVRLNDETTGPLAWVRGDATQRDVLFRTDESLALGPVTFSEPTALFPVLNDHADLALIIEDNDSSAFNDPTLALAPAGQAIRPLVQAGVTALPTGDATIDDEIQLRGLNNAATPQALFTATLDVPGAPNPAAVDEGLFVVDAQGTLTTIAREGDDAPGGGTFGNDLRFADASINDAGQVAFAHDDSLYFFDPSTGLIDILKPGDTFDGGVIQVVGFGDASRIGSVSANPLTDGLNNLGQIAFAYQLTDGRIGAAVWSVPEPAALTTVAATLLVASTRRRRRRDHRPDASTDPRRTR